MSYCPQGRKKSDTTKFYHFISQDLTLAADTPPWVFCCHYICKLGPLVFL